MLDVIISIAFVGLLFGLPLAAIIFFVISLCAFLKTPEDDIERRNSRKLRLIISSVIAALFVTAIIVLMVFFSMAMAHM